MKRTLLCLFLLFSPLYGAAAPTLCLNMIVKNETAVIESCLNSVKGLIDYWVIVDTGSDDGTQEIIRKCLQGIPGELHEKPWVNFGHNRQEALELAKAKGDYILLMDADELLEIDPCFNKTTLREDCYVVTLSDYTNQAKRILLFNNHLKWEWKDVIHEYLVYPPHLTTAYLLEGITCYTKYNGYRSQDPLKFLKDAAILEKELEKDPTHSRYTFYLAQSYANAGEYALALKNYQKRVELGDAWSKELFWSLYMCGKLQELLDMPHELYLKSYSDAFAKDSTRVEPLFRLADYFYRTHNYIIAYTLAKLALSIPPPLDEMYCEHWMHEYGILLALASSAHKLHRVEEARALYHQILARSPPAPIQEEVKKQLEELLAGTP